MRSRDKHERIAQIRQSIGLARAMPRVQIPMAVRMMERYQVDTGLCPCCKKGRLITIKDTRAERRKTQRPFPKIWTEKEPTPS